MYDDVLDDGPTSVRCLACDYRSSDPLTVEVVNDQTGVCPNCGSEHVTFEGSGDR